MAGQVYPSDAPRPTGSHGEGAVHEALKKHLPDGWRAWHSLRLRAGSDWEGEGDFVVAIPGRGLLVLEVKGGAIELRGGHWYQNGQRLQDAPRDQGQRFARRLVEAVQAKTDERPPFGVVSVFPDVEFTEPPRAGDLTDVVIGRRELPWLDQALRRSAEAAIPSRLPAPRTDRWLGALHELWGHTWVPHVRIDDRIEDAERRAVALNRDQLRILDSAEENVRAVVTGGAGTGKTIVAAELCRRWRQRGKSTLLLCFTDALAKALDDQFARDFPKDPLRPRAAPLRKYAVELLRAAGHEVAPKSQAFWTEVGFQAACDALPPEADRPDLTVVDEGQDFEENDWLLVEQLSHGRALWVFHDPLQAFWKDRALPAFVAECPTRLRLPKQVRCPEVIERFAALYGDDVDVRALPPPLQAEPSTLRIVFAEPDEVTGRVRHELDELRRQGAKPSDIAIVSLGGQLRSELFNVPQLGSHRLVHADDPESGKHVIADTFLRFKGLERPFVIVTELDASVPQYLVRMRIALTRATVGMAVVCSQELAEADPRLRQVTSPHV